MVRQHIAGLSARLSHCEGIASYDYWQPIKILPPAPAINVPRTVPHEANIHRTTRYLWKPLIHRKSRLIADAVNVKFESMSAKTVNSVRLDPAGESQPPRIGRALKSWPLTLNREAFKVPVATILAKAPTLAGGDRRHQNFHVLMPLFLDKSRPTSRRSGHITRKGYKCLQSLGLTPSSE